MKRLKLIIMAMGILLGTIAMASPGKGTKDVEEKDWRISFIRPGIHAEVLDIQVESDGTVQFTFRLVDDFGGGLDVNGFQTPGPISTGFFLSEISDDRGTFRTIHGEVESDPDSGFSSFQPDRDRTGQLETLDRGHYRYTFGDKLPQGFDPDRTYGLAAYFRRDLRDFDMDRVADNIVQGFVPSGGEPSPLRDVVRTDTCNNCHTDLAFHGGTRKEVNMCSMCHQPGVLDLETGIPISMEVMIHKIHAGHELPSSQTDHPYQIIRGSRTYDYSHVVFPPGISDCSACHKPDVATPDSYLTTVTRELCGSCHDDINFDTGEGHFGLPQADDSSCTNCHTQGEEGHYNISVAGAHTPQYRAADLEGIVIDILDVVDTAPGQNPTVHYTLTTNNGTNIDPASFPFFNFVMAGPNTDYMYTISNRAVEASIWVNDHYEFTFSDVVPLEASGSFTMGAEAFRMVELNIGQGEVISYRETAENPVFYFAVTDAAPIARRTIVSDAKCEQCHGNLALHGTIRHEPSYCVTCHTPVADDSIVRTEETMPARSIDFKFMIHRIHKGADLLEDYTIIGHGSREVNYNHVVFPGILNNCTVCHEGDSYMPPAKGNVSTIEAYEFFSPIPPTSAACLGCHDSIDAASHAYTNIAPQGESCETCHGPGKEFAVDVVHGIP